MKFLSFALTIIILLLLTGTINNTYAQEGGTCIAKSEAELRACTTGNSKFIAINQNITVGAPGIDLRGKKLLFIANGSLTFLPQCDPIWVDSTTAFIVPASPTAFLSVNGQRFTKGQVEGGDMNIDTLNKLIPPFVQGTNQGNLNDLITILPLTMTYLGGYQDGDKLILEWSTSQEVGVSHYDIYVGMDGMRWTNAGRVNARNQGLQTEHYKFEYKPGHSTNLQYVLFSIRSTDLDNTVINWPVIALSYQSQGRWIKAFNTSEGLVINWTADKDVDKVYIFVCNTAGTMMHSVEIPNSGAYVVKGIPNGLAYVIVSEGQRVYQTAAAINE